MSQQIKVANAHFTFPDCNLEICMEALNQDAEDELEMSTCQTIFDDLRRQPLEEPAQVVNYLIDLDRKWVMLGFESHILLLVE